jgi:transcriptional regulator with XRE-family HTH domain
MKKQSDLAAATGLSVSVISLAERGSKVEPQTLNLIEMALGFPQGSFVAYAEGRGEEPGRVAGGRKSAFDMTLEELTVAAATVADVYGSAAGEKFVLDVLAEKERRRTGERQSTEADAG